MSWRSERETTSIPRPVHPAYISPKERQDKALQENNGPSSIFTFTFAAFSLVTIALAAKAIRSSHRIRQAEYDARAWRRAFMTSIDRLGYRDARHLYGKGRHEGRPVYGGIRDAEAITRETKLTPSAPKTEIVADKYTAPPAIQDAPSTSGTRYKASYSAIHPHEDWDWKPADHPPMRNSWKRNRLPPWAVGFSSAVKATPTEVKTEPKSEVNQMSRADREEELLKAYMWPDYDPLKSVEAATIAEEVFKEATQRSHIPTKEKEKLKKPTGTQKAVAAEQERVRDLERQVWALLERTKELEDRWRWMR